MAWSLGGEDGGVGPLELPMCGLELKELRIKAMRCTRLDKRCSGDLRSISSLRRYSHPRERTRRIRDSEEAVSGLLT